MVQKLMHTGFHQRIINQMSNMFLLTKNPKEYMMLRVI